MATVIPDSLAEGLRAEEIVENYPSVSREAVQATLLYAAELEKERIVPLKEEQRIPAIDCDREL